MTGACPRCQWAEPVIDADGAHFECHLLPPTPVAVGFVSLVAMYPHVGEDDWCSHWEPEQGET